MYIINTFFKKINSKHETDGKTNTAIDFIITNRKHVIKHGSALNRFSIGTDYRIVRG